MIALGVALAILYFGRVFFITSLAAVIIAFILEPFVELLMRIRFPRSLASFVVCTLALLLVYLMGIGAYTQISGLLDDLPKYAQRISQIVESAQQRVDSLEQTTYQLLVPARQRQQQPQAAPVVEAQRKSRRKNAEPPQPPPGPPPIQEVRIHEESNPIVSYVYSRLGSFYQLLLMSSFVPFLVYFMLSWRDHINRSFLQFFDGEDRLVASRSLQGIADMVRAFVVGNFLLGLLLTIVQFARLLDHPRAVPAAGWTAERIPQPGSLRGIPLALVPPMFVALAQATSLGYFIIFLIVASSTCWR